MPGASTTIHSALPGSAGLPPPRRSPAYVPLFQPPATLTAGLAVRLEFTAPVDHLCIQNNTAAPLYLDWTNRAASAASWQVPAGGSLFLDIRLDSISIYAAGTVPLNGSSGGVVLVGLA